MLEATIPGPERHGAEGAESGKQRGRVGGSAADDRAPIDVEPPTSKER